MKKRKSKKTAAAVAVLLCLAVIFGTVSTGAYEQRGGFADALFGDLTGDPNVIRITSGGDGKWEIYRGAKKAVSVSGTKSAGATFTSSNSAIVSCTASGKITGVGEGTATITATTKDRQYSSYCKVTCLIPVRPAVSANLRFPFAILFKSPNFLDYGGLIWVSENVEIIGKYFNSYYYVRYQQGDTQKFGYILKIFVIGDAVKPEANLITWKSPWAAKALKDTSLRKSPSDVSPVVTQLPKGGTFTVTADTGDSSGWVYGKNGTGTFGYVKIGDISNKGTVSQYNNLKWLWPVDNAYNNISSPFGTRSSGFHKGFDITTGEPGKIKRYPIRSAFDGEVRFVASKEHESCGYYICIATNDVDPISGKKICVVYMHMAEASSVTMNRQISKGTVIGYVGTTGDSSGYHLHFEANNQNARVGDEGRKNENMINPVFFYMDKELTYDKSNNFRYAE